MEITFKTITFKDVGKIQIKWKINAQLFDSKNKRLIKKLEYYCYYKNKIKSYQFNTFDINSV